MVNKEKRYRQTQRANGVILGAAIVQSVVALLSALAMGSNGQAIGFVTAFVYLALAIFFGIFKHPAFGIAYTALYAADKLVSLGLSLWLLSVPGGELQGMALLLGVALAAGLLAFFIYADYQAVVLRRLERELEE